MSKMIFSMSLVFTGLFLGYFIQLWTIKNKTNFDLKIIRRKIQSFILLVLVPPTIIFSIWIAPIKHAEILTIPILGAVAPLFGGFMAWLFSRPLRLNNSQKGVFMISGIFTNMGALGGLVAFLLLGEEGFALVSFYQLFEKFVYFLIGFPIAKNHSPHRDETASRKNLFIEVFKDPVIITNFWALVIGITLNLAGIRRPEALGTFNAVVVPLSSLTLLVSIGMAMSFGSIRHYVKISAVMIVIKSVLTPALIFGLGTLLGLGNFAGGLGLKMAVIIAAMPVGFLSLVPPTLYDMDMDQANSCWFISTMSLVFVFPVLQYIIPLIG